MLPLAIVVAWFASEASAQAASYAPNVGACPSTPLLRQSNGSLASGESAYVDARLQAASSSWATFAQTAGYTLNAPPRTALACSGGGYRASLYCAGVMSAFDSRNTSSPVAGVLDRAAYLAGLSGGSWTVSSYSIMGAPSLYDLVLGNSSSPGGWQLDRDLLLPAGAIGIVTGNNGDCEHWPAAVSPQLTCESLRRHQSRRATQGERGLQHDHYGSLGPRAELPCVRCAVSSRLTRSLDFAPGTTGAPSSSVGWNGG